MKILSKIILYILTILHSPFTLVRVFVATVIMVDLWCDKTINNYLKGVEKEMTKDQVSKSEKAKFKIYELWNDK